MEHTLIPAGERHAIHQWVVADADARGALTPVIEEIGCYAWQQDDNSEWMLLSVGPSVWLQRGQPGEDAEDVTWDTLPGKPTEFPPADHTHPTSEITGLDDTLAGLESATDLLEGTINEVSTDLDTLSGTVVGHTTAIADFDTQLGDAIIDIGEQLDLKVDLTLVGAANGVAELDSDGNVPSAQLPSIDDAKVGWGSITSIVGGVLSRHASIAAAVAAVGSARAAIVIRGDTTVSANTTIPYACELVVENRAIVTVDSGITLAINGSCRGGQCQVFAGAGTVAFGYLSRAVSPKVWFATGDDGAVFNTRRTLIHNPSALGGPVHAFEDDNSLNFTHAMAPNYNAYASYDAKTTATGTGDYDHMVAFQARQTYTGSGSIWSRWDPFNSLPTHSGSGVVAQLRHFRAENPLGTGPITFQAAFYCEKLTRASENYGLFSLTPLNIIRGEAGEFAQLRLQGNGQTGGNGFYLSSQGDSSASVWQAANSYLRFGVNNAECARFDANGRVGFGMVPGAHGGTAQMQVLGLIDSFSAQGTDGYFRHTILGKVNTVLGFNDSGSTNVWGVPDDWSYVGNLQAYPLMFMGGSSGILGRWDATSFRPDTPVAIQGAGNGLKIPEGSDAKMGTATLVGGTVTVANTSVAANSRIFLTVSAASGTQGHLRTTKSAGASFTITSTSASETSTVDWLIVDPS
jgi:hypothetical protein